MYSIYVITNTVNGKQYVGYTSREVDARWKRHVYDSNNLKSGMYNSPLQIDIRKYGEDAFVHHVVETTHDKRLAIKMEDIVTEELNTIIPNGYNRQVGYHCVHTEDSKKKISVAKTGTNSGSNNPFYGKHHTDESKKKISESRKGIPLSEETKRKLSESNSGENNPNYGKHHSEETKRKIREKRNNPVVCIETGIAFDSCKVASEWAGLKNGTSSISRCCKGKQKTAGGYHWMWLKDYLEQNKEK